jgi:capsular polysaccharide biosynthesis protein
MVPASARRPPIPFGVFFSVFMIVFTVVFGWTAISTTMAPRSYASYSRIEISPKSGGEKPRWTASDHNFTKTETEIILSEQLLQKVIVSLNLNEKLGNKYFNGETLKSWETLELIKSRMTVCSVPDTSLIEIRVYDDNPTDPAVLANAVANAYINYVSTNSGSVDAQIVDKAYPIKVPIRPNVVVNLTLGTSIGIFLGFIVGTAVAGFVYIKNRNDLLRDDVS